MTAIVLTLALLVGLALGSFLNVVVTRVPAGRSVVSPGSACPCCGSAIRRHDNIPVLSWLLLRGRCRDCAGRIPWRYPALEGATGVWLAACAWALMASGRPGPSVALLGAGVLMAGTGLAVARSRRYRDGRRAQ